MAKRSKTTNLIFSIISMFVMGFFIMVLTGLFGIEHGTIIFKILAIAELGNILGIFVISLSFAIEPLATILGAVRIIRQENKNIRKDNKREFKHKKELQILRQAAELTELREKLGLKTGKNVKEFEPIKEEQLQDIDLSLGQEIQKTEGE